MMPPIFAVMFIVVFLVALEVGLRTLTSFNEAIKQEVIYNQRVLTETEINDSVWLEDLTAFVPNSNRSYQTSEYSFVANHDHRGYRNPCFRDESATRIGIGDSFVYGVGVDDKNTLQCQLSRLGIGGYYTLSAPGAGPYQYKRLLNRATDLFSSASSRAIPIDLFVFLGNDFEEIVQIGRQGEEQLSYNAPSAGILREFGNELWEGLNRLYFEYGNSSYFLTAVKMIVRRYRNSEELYVRNRNGSSIYRIGSENVSASIAEYIRLWKGWVVDSGFRTGAVIVIPSPSEMDAKRLAFDLKRLGYDDVSQFDQHFKSDQFRSACSQLVPDPCVFIDDILQGNHFYEVDNHLTDIGLEILSLRVAEQTKKLVLE